MPRRALGALLLLHGGTGLVLVGLGLAIGLSAASQAEELSTRADATLLAAVDAAEAAAAAFGNADVSLEQGGDAARGAAELATDASATLAALSAAMELSVFGAQPLLPLADDFRETADQAAAVAAELATIGGSLEMLRTDLDRVSDEVRGLAGELDTLRGSSRPDPASPPLRLLLILALGWVTLASAASLLAGAWLLGGLRRPQDSPQPHQ